MRLAKETGSQGLVHDASPDLVTGSVDAHEPHPHQSSNRRQVVIVLRVGSGLPLFLQFPDRGSGNVARYSMARQDVPVFREDLRELQDRAPSGRMVRDDEIVAFLLGHEQVRRVHIDAKQHALHVLRRNIDRRVGGSLRLLRKTERDVQDFLGIHQGPEGLTRDKPSDSAPRRFTPADQNLFVSPWMPCSGGGVMSGASTGESAGIGVLVRVPAALRSYTAGGGERGLRASYPAVRLK